MDATSLHITEYRGNQEIDFFGITSFKVQNHGESVVEINTIPIYPGKTVKIIEEDSTQCNFKMIAKFTEEGKIPKFRAIYKQFGNADCYDHLHQPFPYAATLYNYEQGDVIDFSQNIAGHTILTRSFDGGVTFLPENDIDLGFIEANQVAKYDLGGSLDTNAIQFRNDDLAENSEIFLVVPVDPFIAYVTYNQMNEGPINFHFNKDVPNLSLEARMPEGEWTQIDDMQNIVKAELYNSPAIYNNWGSGYLELRFIDTGSISQIFDVRFNIL